MSEAPDATATPDREHAPDSSRTIVALFAAPICGCTIAGIAYALMYGALGSDNPFGFLLWTWMFAILVGFTFGLPVALSLGWLIHILLLRIGFAGPFVYACVGASLAIATFRIAFAPMFDQEIWSISEKLGLIMTPGIAGGVGALVFWFIRRPNRDAISAQPQP